MPAYSRVRPRIAKSPGQLLGRLTRAFSFVLVVLAVVSGSPVEAAVPSVCVDDCIPATDRHWLACDADCATAASVSTAQPLPAARTDVDVRLTDTGPAQPRHGAVWQPRPRLLVQELAPPPQRAR